MAEPRRRTTLQFGRVEDPAVDLDAQEAPAPTVRTPRNTLVQRRSPTVAQLPAEPPKERGEGSPQPSTSPPAEPDAGRYSFVSPIRRRKT